MKSGSLIGFIGLAAIAACAPSASSGEPDEVSAGETARSASTFNWWRNERTSRQAAIDEYVAQNRADFDAFRRNPAGNTGVPMIIFRLLPELFPEIWGPPAARFADSFAKIGLSADPFEPSRVLPLGLGFSGLDPAIPTPAGDVHVNAVQVTCMACHNGRVTDGAGNMVTAIGAPSTQFQYYRFRALTTATVNHPGYTAARFAEAVRAKAPGWLYNDATMARQEALETAIFLANPDAMLGAVKAGANAGAARLRGTLLATTYTVPNSPDLFGPAPGHMDAMSGFASLAVDPSKFATKAELAAVLPAAPAAVDHQPIWRLSERSGYKWANDVGNGYFADAIAAFGMIGSATAVDMNTVNASTRFALNLPSAPYPFDVDRPSAARGQHIYAQKCASCHAPGNTNVLTPEESGTDPNRSHVFTPYSVAGLRAIGRVACHDPVTCTDNGQPVPDERILQISPGIAAVPLSGIWARAPYLHNGSVPTLRALLTGERPAKFYRGNTTYDTTNVGFAYTTAETPASAEYDTGKAGNSNGGHLGALFGGDWSARPRDVDDLIEYMKTL